VFSLLRSGCILATVVFVPLGGCSEDEPSSWPYATGGAGGAEAGLDAGAGGIGGTGGSGGSAGAGGTGTSGTGGTGGVPLLCDDRFSFSSSHVAVGVPFDVSFTDTPGYAHVDVEVTGPGDPVSTWQGMGGDGPYTWTWRVDGHGAGVLDLRFMKDKEPGSSGTLVASCQVESEGTGGTGGTGGAGGTSGAGGSGGATSPPANRYGMGYVHEGNAADHDLTRDLVGPGGHVLVIFADVRPDRHNAEPSWKNSIADAYARDLVPVIRMAPPWGDRRVRNQGESPTSYLALGQAYRDIVADLPLRDGWPLYVAVHNEPNLCYEWACDQGVGWLYEDQLAGEYAAMLRDVADAVHALGDPRIKVTNGALAPGGVTGCECGTDNWQGGTTALTYLQKMKNAVPDVFDRIDVFSTHSYPAQGDGWGFFCAYADAMPGLTFFEKELQAIGKPNMGVLVTETGWTIEHEANHWSREQVAEFTVQAYQNVWETHPSIVGVTPFILRDAAWDKFAWVQASGTPYPVYDAVRAYRCGQPGAQGCN